MIIIYVINPLQYGIGMGYLLSNLKNSHIGTLLEIEKNKCTIILKYKLMLKKVIYFL